MKLSRADYNKPWRCPGWSGQHPAKCAGGSLAAFYSADGYKWKNLYKPHWTVYQCPKCGIYILPFILRYIEPGELLSMLKWKIRDLKWKILEWRYARDWRRADWLSDACRANDHEECDRLAWLKGRGNAVYCICNCGCDGEGQDALV